MPRDKMTGPASIPSVDRVLGWPDVEAAIADHGRPLVREAVRAELDQWRRRVLADGATVPDEATIAAGIAARIETATRPGLRRVLNLTGTVLHTNLGRAPLAPEAIDAMIEAATGAANLEFDIDGGKRGDRDDHLEALLRDLTGAEAVTVVNNNAAAVLLTLNALAARREVIVSRGELIEIGGAFRLPDIMARAGCRLREVGTTNRTHPRDYADAIGPKTALLMKAHTSNYAVQGFTAAVSEKTLADIAHDRGLPAIVDLGSGTLVDLERYGLPHEPTPREMLAAGADIVTFSGDKLLGGPQAGIIVGRADLVTKIKRNPMKRAMRCDKVTIAALAATLRLYADPERLAERLPTLRLLTRSRDAIEAMAKRLAPALDTALKDRAAVSVEAVKSQIGSGSLPVESLPSAALVCRPPGPKRGGGAALLKLAADFRALPVPIIGRVQDGALWFDLRCLEDEGEFAAQLDHLARAAPA